MKMNLLWYLFFPIFAFLLITFVFWLRKRARFCLLQAKRRFFHAKLRWKQAKRWWKKDWNTKLTDLDAFLEKKREFLETHKNSFSCFGAVIGGIIFLGFILVACFKTKFIEFSTIVGAILAFIISFMTLVRMFRQFHNQAKQIETQAKQLERQAANTQKQIAAEQFKNAVDHLGSKKQAVVLGGVHALHNLATTFPEQYSKQVFEVLCGFIREETVSQEYKDKVEVTEAPSIVIQTIVDKLFREKVEVKKIDKGTVKKRLLYRNHKANLAKAFLLGVNFHESHLQDADLKGAIMQEAVLLEANLRGADLQDANLKRAKLKGAYLQDADFRGAILLEVDIEKKDFVGADIRNTEPTKVGSKKENLQSAKYLLRSEGWRNY